MSSASPGRSPSASTGRVGLRVKLLGLSALLLAFTALVGLLGIQSSSSMHHKADEMFTYAVQPLADLGVVRANFNENRAYANLHILSSDVAAKRELESKIAANTTEVSARLAAAAKTLTTAKEKATFAAWRPTSPRPATPAGRCSRSR